METQDCTRPFGYQSLSGVDLVGLTETAAQGVLQLPRAQSLPNVHRGLRESSSVDSTPFLFGEEKVAVWTDRPPNGVEAEQPIASVAIVPKRSMPAIASDVPSQIHTLGEFNLMWDNTVAGAGLRIRHNLVPDSNFSTPLGRAFIRSGRYAYSVDELHSSFAISHQTESLSQQTVDAIKPIDNGVLITGKVITEGDCQHAYELNFTLMDDRTLDFNLRLGGEPNFFTEVVFTRDDSMPLWGFGEQFTHMDMNGKLVPMLTQEGGVGRGQWPISPLVGLVAPGAQGNPMSTYFPMSVCHNGQGVWIVDNTQYHEYDARAPGQLKILSLSPDLRGHLIAATDPADRIEALTDQLGRMPKLPAWSQRGAIVGIQGGRDIVLKRLALLQEAKVPIAALWIQDWVGQRRTDYGLQLWWNYEVDSDHYRDIKQMRDDLKAQNIRLLGYVNPMIVDITDKPKHKRNFFEEGKRNGYFVKNAQGDPYPIHVTIYGHLVDLTNPQARQWYKDILVSSFLEAGEGEELIFDGGMMDFGEGLPFDSVLYDGTPAAEYHNQYPVEWARLVNEVRHDLGMHDLLFFHRSGFTGSLEAVSDVWAGDQNHTYDRYDGLHSAMIGMLTAGLSGISHSHSDIGGYTTIAWKGFGYNRPEHLLTAWMEYCAFTSLFRSHEGSEPKPNAQVYSTPRLRHLFGRCTRIFAGLANYRCGLMSEAERTGMPLTPALGVHYPQDPRARACDTQFLLGRDLLVAPNLSRTQSLLGRNVYLPAGQWMHLWTGEVYGADSGANNPESQGVNHWFKSKPGHPTAFVRVGSALQASLPDQFAEQGLGCFGAPDVSVK
jgi:alpha-glucosidase